MNSWWHFTFRWRDVGGIEKDKEEDKDGEQSQLRTAGNPHGDRTSNSISSGAILKSDAASTTGFDFVKKILCTLGYEKLDKQKCLYLAFQLGRRSLEACLSIPLPKLESCSVVQICFQFYIQFLRMGKTEVIAFMITILNRRAWCDFVEVLKLLRGISRGTGACIFRCASTLQVSHRSFNFRSAFTRFRFHKGWPKQTFRVSCSHCYNNDFLLIMRLTAIPDFSSSCPHWAVSNLHKILFWRNNWSIEFDRTVLYILFKWKHRFLYIFAWDGQKSWPLLNIIVEYEPITLPILINLGDENFWKLSWSW